MYCIFDYIQCFIFYGRKGRSMIQLSDIQIEELRRLQQLTVDENPDLKNMLHELCYMDATDERPWGQNYDLERYLEFIPNFNFNAYNQYMGLLKKFNIEI